MPRAALIVLSFAFSAAAWAQQQPDEDWAHYPPLGAPPGKGSATPAAPPAADVVELAAPPMPPPPGAPKIVLPTPARPPDEPNNVSIYGAPTLGQWKRGLGVYMGFPLLGARFAIGLLNRLDAGVAFDSMYGVMNDFRLHLKWQLVDQQHWSFALAAEGGYAQFAQSPQSEGNGPRWLTGRRDWNIMPGAIISYRGDSPHSPRLFLDTRCAIAIDTEPYAQDPLSGNPSPVTVAGNFIARAGAEMPFSAKTSFLFVFGFDIHGRPEDSPFMIAVSVGIVTSI
jgi:hypothetical protein